MLRSSDQPLIPIEQNYLHIDVKNLSSVFVIASANDGSTETFSEGATGTRWRQGGNAVTWWYRDIEFQESRADVMLDSIYLDKLGRTADYMQNEQALAYIETSPRWEAPGSSSSLI